MLFLCPGCQRSFDEPGFCPFDGAALVGAADPTAPTILSGRMAAVRAGDPDARPTEVDGRRGTFPLTPSGPPGPPAGRPTEPATEPATVRTKEITAPRRRPVPPTPAELPKVRAVSASQDPHEALEAYRAGRDNEYDKLVGQTLDGRYFVQKKIGEGGMGVVFAARHSVIERPLAIKVLKREVMRDQATIRRFVQEAKAASRIGHPNIVDVTDFGTTPDGMTYSVMEYVDGQTLGAAIRAGAPFSMVRATKIAAQIARALGAAHDKGIVHRDLKPENVFLLDRDGRTDFVKIVDFGIAKVTPVAGQSPAEPRLTRAGSVFGTPEYMAPEQAAGRSDTDGRVDIYALGVILYEMVTGRVPHRGDSMVRTLAMQMLDPVEPPTKVRPDLAIPPELEALILRALEKKREQRFQTMGELLAAIDGLQTPVGLSVTGSPVYALVPLPPGADPALAGGGGVRGADAAGAGLSPAPPVLPAPAAADVSAAIQVAAPVSTAPGAERHERARTPTQRRLKDEPEFVTHEKPITFEHVFTEEHAAPRRRAWPVVLLAAVLLGAAGGGVALVIQKRSRGEVAERVHERAPPDAAPAPAPDAELVAELPDAGAPDDAGAPEDAGPPPPDGAVIVRAPLPDAGVRPGPRGRDGGVTAVATPNGRGTITIQVLTKPESATLYAGTEYRGPGGTTLEEPYGTTLEITCRHAGYKPGTVRLVFDGTREAELCVLQRIVVCIPGVKNPFDDCPD